MRYSTILAVSVALGLSASANAQAPAGQNQPVQEQNGQKNDPGTVGAMQDQAGNQAMSPEDVRRQTQGKPPMQQQALKGKPQQQPANPDPTGYSAGTVGAAPGTNPPMGATDK